MYTYNRTGVESVSKIRNGDESAQDLRVNSEV